MGINISHWRALDPHSTAQMRPRAELGAKLRNAREDIIALDAALAEAVNLLKSAHAYVGDDDTRNIIGNFIANNDRK